jgi:uncharacterized repeat protein (TIGR01451 family)
MKFPFCVTRKKHSAFFRIVSLMLATAPLWLMLAAVNPSAHAQGTPSPADWTQFLGDNMQRWNPYETKLGVSNVGSLQLNWKIGPFNGAGITQSSPAVANGVVYFGGEDYNVYALNASTGALLWSYHTGGYISSSPAVVNGVVYIGSDDFNVYALNATTGAKLWSSTTGSYNVGGSGPYSPSVANGVVYIGSDDGHMYALNASTGALLWRYAANLFYYSSSPPAVANGVVYFGSGDGNVYALNASTGALLWMHNTGLQLDSSPVVANGVVFIGGVDSSSSTELTLYALNASTGALLWSNTIGPNNGTVAVANGVVYVGGCEGVCALNADTGALLWSSKTGSFYTSSPAVANGVVYIAGFGEVYALNASTGVQLWSHALDGFNGFVMSSPTVADGAVYIRSGVYNGYGQGQGHVYAFALSGTGADLFLRVQPTPTTVHPGDLLTYAVPVWNMGPANAVQEVLNTQVPAGTTFDSIHISGTPGLGTCTAPPYQGTGQIVCHENGSMAPNTTWTVRLTVKVTAPAGTVLTENAATMSDTPDPILANNAATVSTTVQSSADLFLQVTPSTTTVHQGDLITYAFPVWNLGPSNADFEVLNTQVPAGTTFDSIRISGTPGLGACTTPPYQGTGQIVCSENGVMAPNTTWTVRLTVKVTAPSGTVITASAATMSDTFDPNPANNTVTTSIEVQ